MFSCDVCSAVMTLAYGCDGASLRLFVFSWNERERPRLKSQNPPRFSRVLNCHGQNAKADCGRQCNGGKGKPHDFFLQPRLPTQRGALRSIPPELRERYGDARRNLLGAPSLFSSQASLENQISALAGNYRRPSLGGVDEVQNFLPTASWMEPSGKICTPRR